MLNNNKYENMNEFLTNLGRKPVLGINDRLTKNNRWVAAISVKSRKIESKAGVAAISINPSNIPRVTSRTEYNINNDIRDVVQMNLLRSMPHQREKR